MLTLMRNIVSSKWGIPLIVLVILGMAVWGIEDIFSGGLGNKFAKAGKRTLTQTDIDRRLETYVRNINEAGERAITTSEAAEQGIVDQIFAIESSKTANMGYAAELGILASPRAIEKEAQLVDAFRSPETGEFDLNQYRYTLSNNGLTPKMYERDVQDELTLKMMRDAAIAGTKVPNVLGRLRASYALEERAIAWFILDKSTLTTEEEPTEEALRAFYTEHLDSFSQPERRVIELLKFSADDYQDQVEVTEDEIATYYEAAKAERFSEPETRTLAMLTFPDEASARAAFGALAGGAPLDDVQGATNIDIQDLKKDEITDSLLADAMFGPGKSVGAIYGPSNSVEAWQITRLEKITPGPAYPLEVVRDVIRGEMAAQRAQGMYYDMLGEIDTFIGAGMTLEEIAKEVGVEAVSNPPVDANGIAEDGQPVLELIEAGEAFTQAFLLNEGDIGDRFDTDTHTYIARTVQIIDARTPPYEEVSDKVRQAYDFQIEADALKSAADAIVARLTSGESSLEAEAELTGSEVDRPPFSLTRTNAPQSGLPSIAVNGIFNAEEGDMLTFPTRNLDQILILKVEAIHRPTEEELAAVAGDAAISLAPSLEQDLQAALETELRRAIGFEANPQALAAYKARLIDPQ